MILGVLAVLAGAVVVANPPRAPRASSDAGRLPQSVYVWQRAWGAPVRTAVVERASAFAGVVVLATELAWTADGLEHAVAAWDADALRAANTPIGLALRIGPCSRERMRRSTTVEALVEHARRVVCEAESRGVEPSELQIDFDCATAALPDYAAWVRAIKRAVSPLPVTITVLPTWMRSDAFGPLVRETAGFVLQVHSVDKARMEDPEPSLCDDRRARNWIEDAAQFGVPFQVALPSYGYLAVFDDRGALSGLVAESPVSLKPDAARVREVRAEPAAMAMLMRDLEASRPATMCGVIWYRLPVDGDRLNWAWPTMQSVMRGMVPEPSLQLVAQRDGQGLVEVQAMNAGDAESTLPAEVAVRWHEPSRLLAADGLTGMEADRSTDAVIFRRVSGATGGRLRPGERRSLGWLRLERDMEVGIDAN